MNTYWTEATRLSFSFQNHVSNMLIRFFLVISYTIISTQLWVKYGQTQMLG